MGYEFFEIERQDKIAIVYLNRPETRNAMNWLFWRDMPKVMAELNSDENVNSIIIAARGKSFTTGIDFAGMGEQFDFLVNEQAAEARDQLRNLIIELQTAVNCVADSPKPVIAAIQRHCIGGGLDLASACDIRVATRDVQFSLFEVKVAIVADIGSLQRLPKIIGEGNVKEMAFTGKFIRAERAMQMGLINEIYQSQDEMMAGAIKMAKEIANYAPIVTRGIKHVLDEGRDMTMKQALNYICTFNSSFLQIKEFQTVLKQIDERKK